MLINKEFSLNVIGTDYIVSDLHGNWHQLQQHLQRVSFNQKTDRLFSVGDLIDRGPKSYECLQLLDQPWFYPVLGNHEDFLVQYFNHTYPPVGFTWLSNGGSWVFSLTEEQVKEVKRYSKVLNTAIPLTITLQTKRGSVGISHAEPGTLDWGEVKEESKPLLDVQISQMLWGRKRIKLGKKAPLCKNIDLTVHGHTIIPRITKVANSIFIDTGGYKRGRSITFLPVEDLFGV